MTVQEIIDYFEENKDDTDVKKLIKELSQDNFNLETAKGFLTSNEEGKTYLESITDSKVTKGIDSWKKNNLKKLVSDEVKKLNPSLTPEQIELQELKSDLEKEKKDRQRDILMNKALSVASEKNIPVSIVGNLIGEDEDSTVNNLDALKTTLDEMITTEVKKKIPDYSSKPDYEEKKNGSITMEDVRHMSRDELLKNAEKIKKLK